MTWSVGAGLEGRGVILTGATGGIGAAVAERLRDEGVAIVLITHLIGFARDAADQVMFRENGQIVESGTASILNEPQTNSISIRALYYLDRSYLMKHRKKK